MTANFLIISSTYNSKPPPHPALCVIVSMDFHLPTPVTRSISICPGRTCPRRRRLHSHVALPYVVASPDWCATPPRVVLAHMAPPYPTASPPCSALSPPFTVPRPCVTSPLTPSWNQHASMAVIYNEVGLRDLSALAPTS